MIKPATRKRQEALLWLLDRHGLGGVAAEARVSAHDVGRYARGEPLRAKPRYKITMYIQRMSRKAKPKRRRTAA